MKRTISFTKGKGSINHNKRLFIAQNVDHERTNLNIAYCDIDLKQVYHELFDSALERYNSKQKRNDRKIDDYFEKIRTSKQEKLFYEIIVQVGNCNDCAVLSKEGTLAVKILDDYMKGFEQRHPSLKVFSAHLHLDESTPHLHIDFVPYTTKYNGRGLDTRVSFKEALKELGFTGEGREYTEFNKWQESEFNVIASIMKEHGIEWDFKGGGEKHLSILDYKKKMRTEEILKLDEALEIIRGKYVSIEKINEIETKPVLLSKKVMINQDDLDLLLLAAKKFALDENDKEKFKKALIKEKEENDNLDAELSKMIDKYNKLNDLYSNSNGFEMKSKFYGLEKNNRKLEQKIRRYDAFIREKGLTEEFKAYKELYVLGRNERI